jgi:hypothetical protein
MNVLLVLWVTHDVSALLQIQQTHLFVIVSIFAMIYCMIYIISSGDNNENEMRLE